MLETSLDPLAKIHPDSVYINKSHRIIYCVESEGFWWWGLIYTRRANRGTLTVLTKEKLQTEYQKNQSVIAKTHSVHLNLHFKRHRLGIAGQCSIPAVDVGGQPQSGTISIRTVTLTTTAQSIIKATIKNHFTQATHDPPLISNPQTLTPSSLGSQVPLLTSIHI